LRLKTNRIGANQNRWQLGFGTVSLETTVNSLGLSLAHTAGSGAIAGASLLTSLPQFLITLLFLNFTYGLTVVDSRSKCARPSLTAAQLAKPARELPLYYAMFMGVVQSVVHWMASLAFFPIIVQTSTDQFNQFYNFLSIGTEYHNNAGLYVSAGFSPIAIIFTLISLVTTFFLLLGVGCLRRYT
jgi:hypothetical protein